MSERPSLFESRAAILKNATSELEKDEAVKTDRRFNNSTPKECHEASYTDILDAYTENVRETIKTKRCYKTIVFWTSMVLLVATFLLLVITIITFALKKQQPEIIEWCSAFIPAIVSFLTVFIVIPKVITKYLFNSEEEKYMSEIIKNIQTYDKEK